MTLEVLSLALVFGVGIAIQRRSQFAEDARRGLWTVHFWTLVPALVFYAFTTVPFDRDIGVALGAAILANWLVIAVGYGYATLVSSSREERGVLALGAGFPNTSFIGYPLAQLFFGNPGLALMVVYDRFAWLVPSTAISTALARLHGRSQARREIREQLASVFVNPPLAAAVAAIALRVADVDLATPVEPLGEIGSVLVVPVGFLLLGLALPLEAPSHDGVELRRAGGALLIRFALAPLLLLACGAALGASIPDPFYLGAAMPCAFNLVVLARVFDLRPHLMRLLVVGSTIPALVTVALAAAVFR
jgi:malate permease and related proteins